MYKDVAAYVHDHSWCRAVKGHYTGPDTQLDSLIVHTPVELLCINCTKLDPLRYGKEDVLVLTGAFSKFLQAFMIPHQKAFTVSRLLVDKWFYVNGIRAHINSEKGHSFENAILGHLYAMHDIKQSTTTPYNLHGNSLCERFNCMLQDMLRILWKEQKQNWSLHLPTLVLHIMQLIFAK